MVMAGTEGVSGPTDESNRLQWLRQRREALQDKLAQKNSELKTLCIEEAELTGVLPPEIPLEPGESPPAFRKRVGTTFSYPQNLINKLKTNEAEESALELERQVQVGKQEAALIIINDSTENKAVRRKHRLIYQQSKQKLQEIDVCLNFIRQSHGLSARQNQGIHHSFQNSQSLSHNSKHRTKKPRPPLDNLGREKSSKHEMRGSLQDQGGISLSPLGPEHNYNVYSRDFQDLESHQFMQPGSSNPNQNRSNYIAGSPVDVRRSNSKFLDHDFNVNNNLYIMPDQFRPRTFSQGTQSTSPLRQSFYQDIERPYRPVPNTFSEEERQYRQLQLQKLEMHSPSYSEHSILRQLDNDSQRRMIQNQYYETEYSPSKYEQTVEPLSYTKAPLRHRRERDHLGMVGIERKHHSALQPSVDSYMPPGYWMRLDDDVVWCPEEQSADRFGSLDRRKHNMHYPNSEVQSRYYTVASSSKNISSVLPRQNPTQVPASSSEQVPSNRILLRTQSLGSVETWHAGYDLSERDQADGRKGKEKEWYETSLDSRCSPNTVATSVSGSFAPSLIRRPSQNNPVLPSEVPLPIREPVPPVEPPVSRRPRELPAEEPAQCFPISPNLYHERPKVLEIPAESKPSNENGNDPILTFNSPTNHTVVQQGKYQPYREVTKPFEMSDFYKYSTKFRKRNEAAGVSPNPNAANNTSLNQNLGNKLPPRVSPVQKSNYPQRKPQMYVLR